MPITSSAKKALRNSAKKRVFNVRRKKKVTDLTKEIRSLAKAKNKAEAQKILSSVYQALDKAAKGGTIKKNTAARKKSRLTKLVKSLDK
jgi:small subunit ribosomal protein S20